LNSLTFIAQLAELFIDQMVSVCLCVFGC